MSMPAAVRLRRSRHDRGPVHRVRRGRADPRLDARRVEEKIRGEGRFAYLARKVTDEQAQKVAALGLKGVALVEESQRYHPSGDMARSILGGVDIDNTGTSGLEQSYGDQLTGTAGRAGVRAQSGRPHDRGRRAPAGAGGEGRRPRAHHRSVAPVRSRAHPGRSGAGDALEGRDRRRHQACDRRDPRHGQHGARRRDGHDRAGHEQRGAHDGLRAGFGHEDGDRRRRARGRRRHARDEDPGARPMLRVGDADFTDAEEHGAVNWSVTEVLAHSSNIGTIKIAQQLGKEPLYDMLKAFGFGTRTAHRLPQRARRHRARPEQPNEWWSTSMGTVPIGQGVSVTPLQMLLGYNVIANGGTYVEPRLVRSTRRRRRVRASCCRSTAATACCPRRRPNKLNLMLRDVVVEGTGKNAAVAGYTPAGKTGTARKPQPGGATSTSRRHAVPVDLRRLRARRAAGAVDHRGHRRARQRAIHRWRGRRARLVAHRFVRAAARRCGAAAHRRTRRRCGCRGVGKRSTAESSAGCPPTRRHRRRCPDTTTPRARRRRRPSPRRPTGHAAVAMRLADAPRRARPGDRRRGRRGLDHVASTTTRAV